MKYPFIDFELDSDRFELRRGGQVVRIEPRVLEVLLYLASNPGRIISKQELIDRVWNGTIVSESALTRCIMEARRVVDDTTRPEPLIRTVHGRGYRFEIPASTEVEAAEPPPSLEIEIPEAPRSDTPLVMPAAVLQRSPRQRLAVVVAVVLAAAGVLGWMARTRAPAAAAAPRARVAILPVSIADDDPALQLIGVSIADLLERRLSLVPGLLVRGPDYSRALSVESASLADLAQLAGAENVISGSLRRGAKRTRAHLSVTLHRVDAQGRVRDMPLGIFSLPIVGESGDVREYVAVRDRVSEQLVNTLMPAVELAPAGTLTPSDPEAYRLYLLARQRLSGGTCDGEAAIELLRQSLELDPRFAPAWETYGWAQYGLSSSCTAGTEGYRRALDAADHALQLFPQFPSAIGLKATVLTETGRVEEAYALLHAAVGKTPANADLRSFSFYVLEYTGYLTDARVHLERLRALDPNFLTQRGWTPNPYLYLGETDRFLEALPTTDAPLFRYYHGLALVIDGRKKDAYAVLEPAFRLNPSDSFARLSQALLAVLDGHPEEARQVAAQFARQRELVGSSDGEMTYKIAQIFALAGDHPAALRQLQRAVDQGFFSITYMESDPLLAPLRATAAYQQIASLARQRHEAFGKRFGLERQAKL